MTHPAFRVAALSAWLVLAALAGPPARAQPASEPAPAAPAVAASPASAPSPPLPPPPPPPPPPAFQGLPWGADEAAIAGRFGAQLVPAVCDAAQRQAAQRRGEWCESPTVPRYAVAGVPFVLTLHLDAEQRRLVRVTLSHQHEPARGDEPRWSEQHRLLRRLLTQRYGAPEFTDVSAEPGQSSATARWRTGPVLIELHSSVQARSASSPAREQLLITYQSPLHGEAAKL